MCHKYNKYPLAFLAAREDGGLPGAPQYFPLGPHTYDTVGGGTLSLTSR